MSTAQGPPPSPPLNDRLLGTLIVIVLRAKNLVNRVRIGKQNPYATVTYGLHKKRTETIERGGQQPTWDAEFRFDILKDGYGDEQLGAGGAAHVDRKGGVLPMASKDPAAGAKLEKPKSAGVVTVGDSRRILKLACWADDNRDPKLVGEGELDIEETIRKGKFDDWVKLERKGRYAGEVYLELTWYSNEPPPARPTRKEGSSTSPAGTYGGAGARLELEEDSEEQSTEEWDVGASSGMQHRTSQGSLGSQNHTPLSLTPDYPDADLAPLSANNYPDADLAPLHRSMSALSVSRPPLPQPPIAATPAPYAPSHRISHSQTYSHFPTAPPAPNGYGYNQDRRASYSIGGVGGSYGYAPQPQPQQNAYGGYNGAGEFGGYQEQQPYAAQHEQQPYAAQPMGEFEQLAHQHYANQSYQQASTSSYRPLPQPQAPPPPPAVQSYDPYTSQYAPQPSQSPYPPLPPQQPLPPMPSSGSTYWHQQPSLPQLPVPPGPPPSASYQQLPRSSSQATIYASPSMSSFAGPPTFSDPPPPPSLSGAYPSLPQPAQLPQPPQPPSLARPPVFSPPPPPPSLQGLPQRPSSAYGSLPPPPQPPQPPRPYSPYHQQYALEPVYDPGPPPAGGSGFSASGGGSGRPPLPNPPMKKMPTLPGAFALPPTQGRGPY